MNGNKVFLTDKKTGDKACVEMLNSATIKVSYSNGKEETFDTKGNLISYNYGAQAPSMKSLNKKKNKFFSKEGFVLGMIIALSILCLQCYLCSLTQKVKILLRRMRRTV